MDIEPNVITLREEQIKQMQIDLKRAYAERRMVTIVPDQKHTKETINDAKNTRDLLADLSEDDVIDADPYVENPYTVTVTDSHLYKNLLIEAFTVLADDGYYDHQIIPEEVNQILEHEYEHHVPAIGNEGMVINYGVKFIEDRLTGSRGIIPFIYLSGRFQFGIYKDVVGATKNPSATDEIRMN